MNRLPVVLLLGLTCTPRVTHAAVLCQTRGGTLKVRDVCRSKETGVDPVALGLQGPKGDQGEQGPPGPPPPDISARVTNSADIPVPNNTDVTLSFDSERWDTAGLHDAGTPQRLTIPQAGKYLVFCHLSWKTQGGGSRLVSIVRNGDLVIATDNEQGDPAHHTELTVSTAWGFAAGDYVEVHVAQDSGTTVNIAANPPGLASALEFGMVRLP
jgi:hypothetical protein